MNATTADLEDDALLHAEAIVYVASASAARVRAFCDELLLLTGEALPPRILSTPVGASESTASLAIGRV